MNPLFFGSSDRPLYGVYHPPKARVGRQAGVVLCYPFGQEYMRAHRAFRQLALLLAKAGFHVFRFDYHGTGDSSGDAEDFTLTSAIADVGVAIDELKDMADVEQVVLFGLRLGGAVVAQAAQHRADVSHLVLWDAIADGAAYLQELHGKTHSYQNSTGSYTSTAPFPGCTMGVMGYPVSPALQDELAALTLVGGSSPRPVPALVIVDAETDTTRALATWCSSGGQPVTSMVSPLPARWDEVDNWGSAMIPQEAIQTIVSWLTSAVR